MKKLWKILCLTAMMSLSLPLLSFAGQWGQDAVGWWYQNASGSFQKNGWYWINDCCYYFNEQGYMLADTTTPDGQTVNSDGAWTLNGVVQTRQSELRDSTISVKVPNGYSVEVDADGAINIDAVNPADLSEYGSIYVTTIADENIALLNTLFGEAGMIELSNEIASELLYVMEYNAVLAGSNIMDLPSGRWHHYIYYVSEDGVSTSLHMYISYVGSEQRIVMVMGENREFTSDQFLMEYIR